MGKFYFWKAKRLLISNGNHTNYVVQPVISLLDWSDNLAVIFEAKFTLKRPSSSVSFYCIGRRG